MGCKSSVVNNKSRPHRPMRKATVDGAWKSLFVLFIWLKVAHIRCRLWHCAHPAQCCLLKEGASPAPVMHLMELWRISQCGAVGRKKVTGRELPAEQCLRCETGHPTALGGALLKKCGCIHDGGRQLMPDALPDYDLGHTFATPLEKLWIPLVRAYALATSQKVFLSKMWIVRWLLRVDSPT